MSMIKGYWLLNENMEVDKNIWVQNVELGVEYLKEYLKIEPKNYYSRAKIAWQLYFGKVGEGGDQEREEARSLIQKNLEYWSWKDSGAGAMQFYDYLPNLGLKWLFRVLDLLELRPKWLADLM